MPSTPDFLTDSDCSEAFGGGSVTGVLGTHSRPQTGQLTFENARRKRYLPPTPLDIALMNQRAPQSSGLHEDVQAEQFRPRGYTMPSYIGSGRPSTDVLERIRQRSLSDFNKRCTNNHVSNHIETPNRMISDSPSPCSSDLISKNSSGESSPRIFKQCKVLIAGYDNVGKNGVLKKLLKLNRSLETSKDAQSSDSVKIKIGAEYYQLFFETINSSTEIRIIEKKARKMNALLLIYSIIERKSFENVAQLLVLTKLNLVNFRNQNPAVLMVANKVDLERAREVTSEEAKKLCQRFDVKHLEISVVLEYNFDQLLKQLSKQIWMNKTSEYTPGDSSRSLRSLVTGSSNDLVWNLSRRFSGKRFNRLWKGSKYWSRSCDQLSNV